jgi:exoribonuclease R
VAELIKKDGLLDSSMKNRDQTIYIKNYYQPMIYDSLKNLFSLKKDEDKLAYSLYFKVNSKGFIDFSTIDFFKSVINVEFNLSHENIGKKLESYPELMNLNMKLDASQLIDSNYMLEC